jgi:hypothetical protein
MEKSRESGNTGLSFIVAYISNIIHEYLAKLRLVEKLVLSSIS